jgi:hypothetical protein
VLGIAHLAALKPAPTVGGTEVQLSGLECFNIQKRSGVEKINSTKTLQRTSSSPKDRTRLIPKSMVIRVKINGHSAKALIDSGSTADLISSALVDQLKIK